MVTFYYYRDELILGEINNFEGSRRIILEKEGADFYWIEKKFGELGKEGKKVRRQFNSTYRYVFQLDEGEYEFLENEDFHGLYLSYFTLRSPRRPDGIERWNPRAGDYKTIDAVVGQSK